MKLLVPSINITEDDGFSPEFDIFNRKPFGDALLNLVQNTEDELVLALDAPWGEGKSTFIKMWQGLLKEKNVPYVYFDAFENDYQTDPFLAISSQIYSLIEEGDVDSHKEFKDKAISALKVVGRASLRVGVKALTAGVLDETVFEETGSIKDTAKEASDLVDNFISNQLTKANEDKEILKAYKEYLTLLGEKLGGEGNVVFIIDELDRCKPKFSLSLLESIKHLFSVPNITFLLVMNREQLEEAVRCEYGRGVDASKYLQKFVSIWTTLPKPAKRGKSVPERYLLNCLNRMEYPIQVRGDDSGISFFEDLVKYYNLSLRDIERSLTNFAIIHNIMNGSINNHYFYLSVFIAITKSTRPDSYRKLLRETITYNELMEEAALTGLNLNSRGVSETHYFNHILKYYLGTNIEVEELIEQGEFNQYQLTDREAISNICNWLEAFQRV